MNDLIITLLFLVTFKYYGMTAALKVVFLGSLLNIFVLYYRKKSLEIKEQLLYGSTILFSGISLLLNNPKFFQYKTSIVYALVGMIFLLTPVFKKKTILELTSSIPCSLKLNTFIVGVFFSAATLNVYMIQICSLEQWIFFKIGLSIVVLILVSATIARAWALHDQTQRD